MSIRDRLIIATRSLASAIDGLGDTVHLRTDPACTEHVPVRQGSRIDRLSRGEECRPCMVGRAFGWLRAECHVPPAGWWCSRDAGHEGPCAARPVAESSKLCEGGRSMMLEDVGDAYETIDHGGNLPVVDALGEPWLLFSGYDFLHLQGVPTEVDAGEPLDHGQIRVEDLPAERWPLTLLVPKPSNREEDSRG